MLDHYGYGEEGWFGELLAAPVDHRYRDGVHVVQFDQQHELLWAGTEGGMLYTMHCPSLSRYASCQVHPGPVLDLQLLSDCSITVSSAKAAVTTPGGFTRAAVALDPADNDQWVSATVEPGTGSSRLLVAGSSGHLYTWDLIGNKVTSTAAGGGSPLASDGFMLLRGPVRGGLAAATAGGRVLLLDSRTKWQSTASTVAHVGGLSCMEVSSGDLVATAGYSKRMGQVMPDNVVKVFDARNMLRPLSTVMPYGQADLLAWSPLDAMSLIIGSSSGLFAFLDVNNPGTTEPYQVDTGGDGLSCAAMSPSGEALVFGGSGGYLHLWSSTTSPRIVAHNRSVQHLKHPPPQVSRHRNMSESGPFSLVPSPFVLLAKEAAAAATAAAAAAGGSQRVTAASIAAAAASTAANTRLLSDVPDMTLIVVGQPPRVLDTALQKDIKQVDFVGYIPNPHYSRSKAPGEARKAATPLQHKRLAMTADKGGIEAARAARIQNRLACGGSLLPQRYRRLVIKAQSSLRYEEFDFSYYNKTRFAGLENDLPNCYCNALLQVLYFIPAFRASVLQHAPEPHSEFCLTCELLFLFKMLLSAVGGQPCQALNLLRALRQNREAAALGLLEGTIGSHQGAPGGGGGAVGGSASLSSVVAAGVGVGGGGAAAGGGLGSPAATGMSGAAAAGGGGGGGGAAGDGGGDGGGSGGASSGQQQQAGAAWGMGAASLAAQSTLPQRMVALCRFLLDHLYKEAGGDAAATAHPGSGGGAADDSSAAAAAAESSTKEADKQRQQGSSSSSKQGSKGGGKGSQPQQTKQQQSKQQKEQQQKEQQKEEEKKEAAAEGRMAAVMQELFGLVYRSDMTALSGRAKGSKKSRQLKTFQVDLQYPEQPATNSSSSSASASGSSNKLTNNSPKPTGAPGGSSCPPSPLQLPLSPDKSPSPMPGGALTEDAAAVTPLNLAGGEAGAGGVTGDGRPSFGSLLAASLRCDGTNRAWFDESCGYAWVRQSRVPLQLPKVLVINCATNNPANVALWRPLTTTQQQQQQPDSQQQPQDQQQQQQPAGNTNSSSSTSSSVCGSWLPWVLQVRSNPSSGLVEVLQADTREGVEALAAQAAPAPVSATYELIAMICHVMDEDEAATDSSSGTGSVSAAAGTGSNLPASASSASLGGAGAGGLLSPGKGGAAGVGGGGGGGSNAAQQGHAVAVIRVLQPYLDPETRSLHRMSSSVLQRKTSVSAGGGGAGGAAAGAGTAGSSGSTAAAAGGGSVHRSSSLTGSLTNGAAGAGGGGGTSSGLNHPLSHRGSLVGSERSLGAGGGGGGRTGSQNAFGLPDSLDDVFAELSFGSNNDVTTLTAGEGEEVDLRSDEGGEEGGGGSSSVAAAAGAAAAPGDAAGAAQPSQPPLRQGSSSSGGNSSSRPSAYRQLTLEPAGSGGVQQQQQLAAAGSSDGWLVINDFSISSIQQSEVMQWYDAQKMPCLLFYTQVSEVDAASQQQQPPAAPTPVDSALFEKLCSLPPLQGPSWRGRRSFTPLSFPSEVPRPGMLVAIDAEFVAVSRAEASISVGQEVQLKPSRLALARVSVLRGAGPSAGVAFIDDYVANVEPVVDYLTRWSGIRPGDLDPSSSTHHLVSLKTAYLKLHHLLDAGCVFVGHGLKQDFRIINLTVPPEQVRDTVELFSFRRQRKLSLRFLASYLLGITIQKGAGQAGAAAATAAAAATSTNASSAAAAAAAASASSGGAGAGGSSKAGGDTSKSSSSKAGGGSKAAGVVAGAVAASDQQQHSGGPAAGVAAVAAAAAAAASAQAGNQPGHGHDSIEDAATALALYNVYCKLVAEGQLEEKLHEMYRWGKNHGWEPVVWVNGEPQPANTAAAVVAGGGGPVAAITAAAMQY